MFSGDRRRSAAADSANRVASFCDSVGLTGDAIVAVGAWFVIPVAQLASNIAAASPVNNPVTGALRPVLTPVTPISSFMPIFWPDTIW